MRLGGVECGQVAGVLIVGVALELQLLVEIELSRVHRLGQLFGLAGQFVQLCQSVLGRIGECGAAPQRSGGGKAHDRTDHRLADNGFRYELELKLQDFASFDCRQRTIRRNAGRCALGLR